MINLALTELWHHVWQLPLIPIHANPHIYMALINLMNPSVPQDRMDAYFQQCNQVTTVYRFPDGRGGNFSHDEVIGAAAYSAPAAAQLYMRLEKNDGYFPDEHGKVSESRYFYRYPFLEPYLRARNGLTVSTWSQVKWSFYVWLSILRSSPDDFDPDGLLKIWLMGQSVKPYPLMDFSYSVWKKVMKKRGIGPKMIFTSHYLNEAKTMRVIAPDDFT